jgi:hypothetical protein
MSQLILEKLVQGIMKNPVNKTAPEEFKKDGKLHPEGLIIFLTDAYKMYTSIAKIAGVSDTELLLMLISECSETISNKLNVDLSEDVKTFITKVIELEQRYATQEESKSESV